MSHSHERKEKVCLNCQAEVYGRYCHVCGQENIEPKESFWHLVTHFTYDVTHFDGKFFSTLRYLLFKPGFISHEYLRGRRASYLHPIRMYVFTSALFFLVFFSVGGEKEIVNVNETPNTAAYLISKMEKRKDRILAKRTDSTSIYARPKYDTVLKELEHDIALLKKDSTIDRDSLITEKDDVDYNFLGGSRNAGFKTLASYDSAQAALPASRRDGFFARRLTRQNLHVQEKYNNDSKAIWNAILDKFKHLFPQMLFVSLPLFALLLKLLYIRRKKFFYVNHVIYTIHLYCGTFILILVFIALNSLIGASHAKTPQWVGLLFFLAGLFYWYKTMRNFYEQGRGKTILKYLLMMLLSVIMMAFIFTIFLAFSAMSI